MPLTHWPPEERPREKLLLHGEKNLSDAELLAIFIRTGIRGKTAVDLARELLIEFGSLKKLSQATAQQLCQKKGLGKAKYALFKAAIELGKRFTEEKIHIGQTLASSQQTKRFLTGRLKHYSYEVFACLFLDIHNRVLAFEELFRGTLHEASIYPREVLKRALAHNAGKIILAHNHPSGNPEPSQSDRDITRLLQQTLGLVDIQIIDHVVIGNEDTVSFAEHGLL